MLILAVSAAFGFLIAFGLGLALSILLFVVSYAQLDFLRLGSDLSLRRSTIERNMGEMDHLDAVGQKVQVFKFSGYLFFGTATRLRARIEAAITSADRRPASIILDFSHVQGIDASAIYNIHLIAKTCAAYSVGMAVCGLTQADRVKFERFIGRPMADVALYDGLDEALQAAEDVLLQDRPRTDTLRDNASFLDLLNAAHPDVELEALFPVSEITRGEALFHAGDVSDEMYVLLTGHVRVQITTGSGRATILAQLSERALIGEVAFYGATPRSADLVATQTSRLIRISREALAGIERGNPSFAISLSTLASASLARRMARTNRLLGAVLQ